MATGFWIDFRHRFTRGLAAVLPTILTIALLLWLISFINSNFARYISDVAQWLSAGVIQNARWLGVPEPGQTRIDVAWNWLGQEVWRPYHLDVIGFLLAIVIIYVLGLFVASFIGRAVWRITEHLLLRVPVIKQIYPSVKQVTDFFFGEARLEFKRVVAVEYPRKGIWSVALVTNVGMRTLQTKVGSELITIFVPSTPTPFTGFAMTVRRDEVIDLPMTIDEAIKYVLSGGMVLPALELATTDSSAVPSLSADKHEAAATARHGGY